MKNEYFNMICQKAPGGKMIMMAVVPDDLYRNISHDKDQYGDDKR